MICKSDLEIGRFFYCIEQDKINVMFICPKSNFYQNIEYHLHFKFTVTHVFYLSNFKVEDGIDRFMQ